MRRLLTGSVGLALAVAASSASAQEPNWRTVTVGAPIAAPAPPAVSLGAPSVALGAPTAVTTAYVDPNLQRTNRVVRGQDAGPAPMPMGPGGTAAAPQPTPLPPPTPMQPGVPVYGMPVPGAPVDGFPPMPGAPVAADACLPGGPLCCDGFAPLPGGVWSPGFVPGGCIFYANFEYLLWAIRDHQLPVLLTTGTPQSNGVLGGGAAVLFGNTSIDDDARSGGRFTIGGWFSRCQNWGWDASYFFLGEESLSAAFADGGTGLLARPFRLPNGTESSEIIAFPRVSAGSFAVSSSNSLWGADVNLKKNWWNGCRSRLDALVGFRFMQFDEDLQISETFAGVAGGPFAGVTGSVTDRFEVNNEFAGGQIGLNGELRRGRWSLNLLTKVAFGNTRQTVDVAGNQVITSTGPNGIPGVYPGLLAQPTNIGRRSQDAFSVVPEVGLTLNWQATQHLKLFVGYNFLYWDNVLRVGDQIDPVLDLVPSRTPDGRAVAPLVQRQGATRPAVPFRDTDFWAQGLNLGLQLSW